MCFEIFSTKDSGQSSGVFGSALYVQIFMKQMVGILCLEILPLAFLQVAVRIPEGKRKYVGVDLLNPEIV